ncbi:MAG: addiction module protein [Planctomycetes bacterium]|nr:addiction module protein [Planctomycetota bacterium]
MAPDKSVIAKLSIEEKYDWLEALVAAIHGQQADESIPDWQLDILKERLAASRANPKQGRDVEQFLAELESEA